MISSCESKRATKEVTIKKFTHSWCYYNRMVQCPKIQSLCSLGLSANQPAVLFSHTKSAPATSQSAVLFSHNKSAPATSHSQANTARCEISLLPPGLSPSTVLTRLSRSRPWAVSKVKGGPIHVPFEIFEGEAIRQVFMWKHQSLAEATGIDCPLLCMPNP